MRIFALKYDGNASVDSENFLTEITEVAAVKHNSKNLWAMVGDDLFHDDPKKILNQVVFRGDNIGFILARGRKMAYRVLFKYLSVNEPEKLSAAEKRRSNPMNQ